MSDQSIFERSETITGLLHEQDGLAMALTRALAELNLPASQEHVLFSLIDAQDRLRNLARLEARRLIRPERRPDG